MNQRMKQVLIIGAGALGMLYGAYSYLAGCHVTYITRRKEQAEQINEKGIDVTLEHGQRINFFPQALSRDKIKDQLTAELVLVVVKQPDLIDLLPWLANHVTPTSTLLFLMNGLGHREQVERFLSKHTVLYGITQCGATKLSDREAMERGRGHTVIGSPLGNRIPGPVQDWVEVMAPYLEIVYSDEIEAEQWAKAMINACINPLTALFKVSNGELVKNSHLNGLMHQVYEELLPLFKEVWGEDHFMVRDEEELWRIVVQVCTRTADNHSSMLQDIRHQRPTEIEALNGYFVHIGKHYGLKLPVNHFLYKAILALEEKTTTSR